ncbi:unnamed protein product [Didymodactylos carnosus]|uniref:Uncharacterized protein n=1 Tax=Didymodactylos carnosus TaxID=1234261 RepID=A0A8S2GRF0_9BILA|nr:unnamed protein product [Didymodactylos carnosus]CAF3554192.1 unnamed protein product [Didymodactylos carnosus]
MLQTSNATKNISKKQPTEAGGSFLLKAGITANIKYLKELFLKKNEEIMKETKVKSKQQTTITTAASNSTPPPSSSIITIAPVSTNSAPPLPPPPMTIHEHKDFILKLIKQWCLDKKENAG